MSKASLELRWERRASDTRSFRRRPEAERFSPVD